MPEDRDKELADFLRRHGYHVPETEEQAQELHRALDFILGALASKRAIRHRARGAIVWGIVLTLVVAATKETLEHLAGLFKGVLK